MSEKSTKIIGVDFSGDARETRKKTWICEGTFDGRDLFIQRCCSITRGQLTNELSSINEPTVVAMDFPFSIPDSFAQFWEKEYRHKFRRIPSEVMPDIWFAAKRMTTNIYRPLCRKFVTKCGEPVRFCDRYTAQSKSPLHRAVPDMIPMTLLGMQMLDTIWNNGRWTIWPFEMGHPQSRSIVEVMPGAVLGAMGLPYQKYKGDTNAHIACRTYLWDNLQPRSGITLTAEDIHQVRAAAIDNDDCLDAVIAAIAAAIWSLGMENFHCPPMPWSPSWDEAILKEGWLYTPCPSRLPVFRPPESKRASK